MSPCILCFILPVYPSVLTWMVCGVLWRLCISSWRQPNCLLRGSSLAYMVKVRGMANRWRRAFIHLYVTLWGCTWNTLVWHPGVVSMLRNWKGAVDEQRLESASCVRELRFSSCEKKARSILITALKCIYRNDKVFLVVLENTSGNAHKRCKGRFRLDIRKKNFSRWVVTGTGHPKRWWSLHSWRFFKTWLDKATGDLMI